MYWKVFVRLDIFDFQSYPSIIESIRTPEWSIGSIVTQSLSNGLITTSCLSIGFPDLLYLYQSPGNRVSWVSTHFIVMLEYWRIWIDLFPLGNIVHVPRDVDFNTCFIKRLCCCLRVILFCFTLLSLVFQTKRCFFSRLFSLVFQTTRRRYLLLTLIILPCIIHGFILPLSIRQFHLLLFQIYRSYPWCPYLIYAA